MLQAANPLVFVSAHLGSNSELNSVLHRYPFYMLSCIDMDWSVLTWLRYTMWIPLYPLGCLSEGIFRNFLSHTPKVAPGVKRPFLRLPALVYSRCC